MKQRHPVLFRLFQIFLSVWAIIVVCVGLPLTGLGEYVTPVAMAQLADQLPPPPQGGGIPVLVGGDIGRAIGGAMVFILNQLLQAAVIALLNAAQIFLGQLAYDAAVTIASAGQGQQSVYEKRGWGKYFEDVAGSAAGEFIGSLSSEFFTKNGLGYDLCKPTDPRKLLQIQLSLGNFFPNLQQGDGAFQRPRPKCELKKVTENWNQLVATMSQTEVFENVQFNLNTNTSDIGGAVNIFGRNLFKVGANLDQATAERKEGEGYKAVKNVISGNVKTPSQMVKDETQEQIVKNPKQGQWAITGAVFTNAFKIGLPQLFTYTASVFANTLVSKLMKRIFEKGIDSTAVTLPLTADAISKPSQKDTRNAFIDLKTPRLQTIRTFEVVSEMMGCPTGPKGMWNCVLDQSLGRALQEQNETGGVTIKRAVENELLHANWRLIPDTDVRLNTDTDCYNKAYCSGNLRKMRVMRILPVGFEFAANSDENKARCLTDGGCVSLREVVDNFANCNPAGTRDTAHPWCKLVDPNWVLASVPQQCALNGYAESLISDAYGRRKDECVDVQTCLKRNDKGDCVGGYGYCMAEKTAYRFGADECLPREASCRNYATRQGVNVSFLRNTVDYGRCNADNVGCLWYATTRNPADGAFANWIGTTTTGDKVYFDKTMETCAASSEGCTQLRQIALGQPSLNLVTNPSFELVDIDRSSNNLVGWTSANSSFVYARPSVLDGEAAQFDSQAYAPSATALKQKVSLVGGRSYVLSTYVRKLDVFADENFRISAIQYKSATTTSASDEYTAAQLARTFFTSNTCEIDGSGIKFSHTDTVDGASWQRFQCTFTAQADAKAADIQITGTNVLVDGIELEEGESATEFVNGLNQSLATVHMKVAPDEFACSGSDSDHPICDNFAKVCRQTEAGCDAYTETRSAGTPIPAIVSASDLCPSACVGYAEYRKEASSFDLVADTDTRFSDPTDASSSYFIPSTGQTCKQEEVGCEAFTNIESQAVGGETTQHFSYVRACGLPGADTQTYYTWEGSDTAGYQLRTWSLKKTTRESPGEAGPEVLALTPGTDRFSIPAGPRILLKRAAGQNFFKEPADCNELAWRGAGGAAIDADCRQFYDSQGNIFYRYYSQTVISSDQCTRYRLVRSNENDCTKTGGEFDSVTSECIYHVHTPESTTCSQAASGCRAYTGSGAGNQFNVLTADFRSGSIQPFSAGKLSTESLLVGDSSLRLDTVDAPGATSLRTEANFDSEAVGLYRVTFWAKAPTGNVTMQVATADGRPGAIGEAQIVGQVTLQADWQRYTVGLFSGVRNTSSTKFILNAPITGPAIVYLDEITVTKVEDTVFVALNSWNTPAVCDRNFAGVEQPQAMLGCRDYRNRNNQTLQIRQFTRLCRQEAIGCTAFVDTRNSAQTNAQTFALTDTPAVPGYPATTTHIALADRNIYLIDDPAKRCNASAASCKAFGKPRLSASLNTVIGFDTVYLKDDITKYSDGLCKASEAYCEEFSAAGGGKEYFRNPLGHVCEYREGIQTARGQFSGWFVKGTETACYPDLIENGANYGIRRRGDDSYKGWVGACDESAGECTEFRDPNQKSALYSSGQPYYFIKNDKIDTTSCAGNTDPTNGCILLRDTADARLLYSTQATYNRYSRGGFEPVPAVDCDANSSNPDCQVRSGSATTTAANDANVLLKVKIDRECSQWLGCTSAETVLDPATGKYKDVCSNLAICDQGTNRENDIFCANYVNRATSSSEPILTRGAYFDVNRYVTRSIGLGQKDYSGYTIPNNFQVSDLKNIRAVVSAFPNDRIVQGKYANEYRLATAVPLLITGTTSTPDYAVRLDPATNDTARRFANLKLCQHVGTRRIGFYVQSEIDNPGYQKLCYLPVSSDIDPDTRNPFNFQNLSERFTEKDPELDAYLMRAYPAPECRSYPEQDSPYGAYQVTEWNMGKTPPQAKTKAAGLAGANTCEFGEKCLCTYKRVEYSTAGVSKFFGSYSQNVPPGICQGGPRDGETCIPSSIFSSSGQSSTANQDCGPVEGGGRCVALSKSTIITGLFGQCLERDITRTIGANLQSTPCLTWNPTPILFGDKDPYHFVPTAGYLPPENAGQYYCTSLAKEPRSIPLREGMFSPRQDAVGNVVRSGESDDPGVKYVGEMSRMSYNDDCVDGKDDCNSWPLQRDVLSGWPRSSMITNGSYQGHQNTPTGDICNKAWAVQQEGNTEWRWDLETVRLIGTGKGPDDGYTEAFFQISPRNVGAQMFGVATSSVSDDQIFAATQDSNIAYFNIEPIKTQNGTGRLGCGYQADWVDNLGEVDYEDKDSIRSSDQEWRQTFYSKYSPRLSRVTEKYFGANEGQGAPYQVPCIWNTNSEKLRYATTSNSGGDETRLCYLKFWQSDYRADVAPDTQQPFSTGLFVENDGQARSNLLTIKDSPRTARCQAEKPYFSIRAVFQTDVASKPPREDLAGGSVTGPWRFVGFWVTSCRGRIENDYRDIYMTISLQNANVCKELAEVRSKDSNQDAAYTDRVWRESGFTVPGTGIDYATKFAPFSSALNTGPAGVDPLFQTGGDRVFASRDKQPTFLASGVDTYFRDLPYPKDKWAYVSNIFARIYRIYRYYQQPVLQSDLACVDGPNFGSRCTTSDPQLRNYIPAGFPQNFNPTCSIHGICDPSLASANELQTTSVCNATSGINAGLRCVTDRLDTATRTVLRGNSDVCHLGPLKEDTASGMWVPAFADCIPNGLTANEAIGLCDTADFTDLRDSDSPTGGIVYRSAKTFRKGSRCPLPRDAAGNYVRGLSVACPMQVEGKCNQATGRCYKYSLPPEIRNTYGEQHGSCKVDADCEYTEDNYYLPNDSTNLDWNYGLPIVSGRSIAKTEYGFNRSADQSTDADDHTDAFAAWNLCLGGRRFEYGERVLGEPSNFIDPSPENCAGLIKATTQIFNEDSNQDFVGRGQIKYSGELSRAPSVRAYVNDPAKAREIRDRIIATFFVGPFAWIGFTGDSEVRVTIAHCEALKDLYSGPTAIGSVGRCRGGIYEGRLCLTPPPGGGTFSCFVDEQMNVVTQTYSGRTYSYRTPKAGTTGATSCRGVSDPLCQGAAGANPDTDANICTHGVGYYPLPKLCPNPADEYCGLISYDRLNPNNSLDPNAASNLPTDVTMGHYSPWFLGYRNISAGAYSYVGYYTPRPPRVAAPDIRNCPTPGQCQVQKLDAFSFDGSSEGLVSVAGGQHKASLRFYAWAAHNQMPLRRVAVDWGDGSRQELNDVKTKNKKPFCGVQKECWDPATGHTGLTCQADTDCPAGSGTCAPVGFCETEPNKVCALNSECDKVVNSRVQAGRCVIRNFFGNSPEACETNYFDFAHQYNCTGQNNLPSCTDTGSSIRPGFCSFNSGSGLINFIWTNRNEGGEVLQHPASIACGTSAAPNDISACRAYWQATDPDDPFPSDVTCGPPTTSLGASRCSGDPTRICQTDSQCGPGDKCVAGLAQPGGCWDTTTNSCRFTPRLFLEDNWGWCSGECRKFAGAGGLSDDATGGATGGSSSVLHPYGGCYSGTPYGFEEITGTSTQKTRVNSALNSPLVFNDECSVTRAYGTNDSLKYIRPWIVYPGSLQLRAR